MSNAFDSYQKQAVEDILGKQISVEEFIRARAKSAKLTAESMQRRIELIASAAKR